MANEAQVTSILRILKRDGNLITLSFQPSPVSFTVDVNGSKGPTPGALTIPVGGKVISFQELGTPGLCKLRNIDPDNYVTLGSRDPDTNRFYPFMELGPGEEYVIKLSRDLNEEYVGTGTGTTGPNNQIFAKANTAECVVIIEAFEK